MKSSTSAKSNAEEGLAVQGPMPEKQDSSAVAKKKDALKEAILREATGTRNLDAASRLLFQAKSALTLWGQKNNDGLFKDGIAMMREIAPQNELEAMLAVQMLAVHEAALRFLMFATQDGQYVETAHGSVLRATGLTRVFLEQLAAIQRLKGKTGQQNVTVKHVHVHEGGQAIVGAVTTANPKLGEGEEVGDERQNNGNTP